MAKEGLPEELGHSDDVDSGSSHEINLASSGEESMNNHQSPRSSSCGEQHVNHDSNPRMHRNVSKRRLIILSHPIKTISMQTFFKQAVRRLPALIASFRALQSLASAFWENRTEEIIRKLYRMDKEEWRPQVCFMGNDTSSTDVTWKSIEDNIKMAPTRFSPEDDDDSLHLHKLRGKAATYLPKLNEDIWTIMAMTTSKKVTLNAVVKELTFERKTPFKVNKPPFVALLERIEAGKPWSQDNSLEPGEWRWVDLDKNNEPTEASELLTTVVVK